MKKLGHLRFMWLVIGIVLLGTTSALATDPVHNVTKDTYYTSIKVAINAAAAGDVINVAAGTYYENNIVMQEGVSLYGAGADSTIIDGNSSNTVLKANNISSATTLDGFTIRHGGGVSNGGGMSIGSNSTLIISNCTFSNNAASNSGGGIYISSSSPEIHNCNFSYNTAGNEAGAIYIGMKGAPVVTDSIFTSNSASKGGAIVVAPLASPTLNKCAFSANSAGNLGDVMLVMFLSTVDAQYNWWGDEDGKEDGPTIGLRDQIAVMGGAVDYSNWLGSDPFAVLFGRYNAAGAALDEFAKLSEAFDGAASDDTIALLLGQSYDLEAEDLPYVSDGRFQHYAYIGTAPGVGTTLYSIIGDAISAASDGNTVSVAPGAYDEAVVADRGVNLLGPNVMVKPVVAGATRGIEAQITQTFTVSGAPGLIVSGFLFESIDGHAIHVDDAYLGSADGLVFRNNIFRNNKGAAIDVHAPTVSGWIIDSNLIDSNTGTDQSGLWLSHLRDSVISGNEISNMQYAGIILQYSENVMIVGNYIHDVPQKGIQVAHSSTGPIVVIGNTISNTVTSDDADEGGVTIYPDVTDMLVLGNILSGNYSGFTVRDKDGAVSPGVHVNWNKIAANEAFGVANFAKDGGDLDATLNWWGSANGPTHASNPLGAGDAVTDHVIYSPWLGIDPDNDPTTVGVQITDPMLIIVDDIGPAPADGYLNAAIAGSNELPANDNIEVRHGSYDASEPITDGVSIYSEVGSAANTILNGPITIDAADILLGRIGQGFTINGPITVGAGRDASTVHINWNDIFDFVINSGDNTLDATFNYWGEDGPDTIGLVAINPILPESSDVIVGYMADFDLNALQAIDFSYLLDGLNKENRALVALDLMSTFFFSMDEALELIDTYGWSHVRNALRWCDEDYDQFLVLLVGYAVGGHGGAGGGGGALAGEIDIYTAGDIVPLILELLNPITGEVVDDALVSYSVCQTLPDGTVAIVAFGVMTYDADLGAFTFNVDTTGYEPGIYDVYLGTDDGRSQHFQIEVTAD